MLRPSVPEELHTTDVVIAGAGLAGLVAAHDLLEGGRRVLLLDKDAPENVGGLAREAFGGVHLIGTPHQKRSGIQDSPDLAYRDWERCAEFTPLDEWPRRWARLYCEASLDRIYRFLDDRRVRFLPVVNWPERGLYRPLNSVPRWHVTWGGGHELVARTLRSVEAHPRRDRLTMLFDREVSELERTRGRVTGLAGRDMKDGRPFRVRAEHVVVASGGICGGDLSRARATWNKEWGKPPGVLLNGAHRYADGLLHDRVAALGGRLTHLDLHWHYAAGVHHPARRRPHDGLSLVPPRGALWLNARGERIGPQPLVGYTDTRFLVESVLRQPGQYSWLVLNWRIAVRELAVSGGDFMEAFRFKRRLRLLKELAFGNRALVERLLRECPEDFVVARSLSDLIEGMDRKSLFGYRIDAARMEADLSDYDAQIDRGPRFFTDDQLRRIMNVRTYTGDRVRTCKYRKILDPKALPLIAIRSFVLSRKSLGGIQTDLDCRVLQKDGTPLSGLYAVGEAAGFGGGGIHGKGSLEGTFLGSCVLTGREAARAIGGA